MLQVSLIILSLLVCLPLQAQLTLGTSTIVAGPGAGSRSVQLIGNGAWTASANDQWLHPANASGANGQTFSFTFDANPGATRSGSIAFNSGALTLTVTQAAPGYTPAGLQTTLVSSGLRSPNGVAVDGAGNVYIADTGNNVIKVWNASTQQVTTLVSGLNSPSGVAVDSSGNVYIADAWSNSIKMWSASTQQVTTLISSGLNHPLGVAVDSFGNVYIADSGSQAIKKWDASSHQVTPIVSWPGMYPYAVALDRTGNIYFSGYNQNGALAIIQWNIATKQAATLAIPDGAQGLAVDGSGNVYFSTYSSSLSVWDAATGGVHRLLYGDSPFGVAVDGAGNVYYSDLANQAVREIKSAYLNAAAFSVPSTAGSGALPPVVPVTTPLTATSNSSWLTIGTIANGVVNFSFTANNATYAEYGAIFLLGQTIPVTQAGDFAIGTQSIVVGPAAGSGSLSIQATGSWTTEEISSSGTTWVHLSTSNGSGTGNKNMVFTYDANPGLMRTETIEFAPGTTQSLTVTQLANGYTSVNPVSTLISAGLNGPTGVAVDGSGNVYIADTLNNAVKKWTASAPQGTVLVSGLNHPSGLATDSSGNIYIADSLNNAIKEWNASTQVSSPLVYAGLSTPTAVAVDSLENLYFNATNGGTGVAEWNFLSQQINSILPQAASNGVAVDVQGNVYFANGNTLQVWNPATPGTVTTLSAALNNPRGLAVDGSGNVYIADSGSNSIKEWNAAAQQLVTLVSAGLSGPGGVAVDGSGNVYIADTGNNALRVFTPGFVNLTNLNEPAVSGSDAVAISFPVFTPVSASSDQTWLTIGTIGSGVVNFSFTTNPGTSARVAHIALLGQSLTVAQAGAGAASLGLTSLLVGPGAGSNSVVLNTSSSWAATANASWLHIASGSTSGSASQTVAFTYDANAGASRTGTLTIASLTVTVTQAAAGYVRAGLVNLATSSTFPHAMATDSSGHAYFLDGGTLKQWNPSTQQMSTLVASGLGTVNALAVDGSGNIFMADVSSNAIKEWSAATQQITTLVSSGLNQPYGVAVDASGNVFIADTGNNVIKEWSSANQQVTTILSANLNGPTTLGVDVAGNLYILDGIDLKKWNVSTHQVSMLGSTTGTSLAVDGSGNLYFGDRPDGLIQVWNAATQQTSVLASASSYAFSLAVDPSGNLYACAGQTVSVVPSVFLSATGVLEPVTAGSDALPPVVPATASLTGVFAPASYQTWLVPANASNGSVSFSFSANPPGAPRIARLTLLGQTIPITQAGLGLGSNSITVGPAAGSSSIALYASQAWTATAGASWLHLPASGTGNQAVVFSYDANAGGTRTGTITFTSASRAQVLMVTQVGSSYFALYPTTPIKLITTLGVPLQVAVDGVGNVFYTDIAVEKWTASTQQLSTVASPGGSVIGLALDSGGDVYYTNAPVWEWNAASQASTLLANPNFFFQQVAVDASGNVYLADYQAIDKWTAASQQVTKIVTTSGTSSGLAADSFGNLYFSDPVGNAIKKWNPASQQVSTVISGLTGPGSLAIDAAGNIFFIDGGLIKKWTASTQQTSTLPVLGLAGPNGIAVDNQGNIYIADSNNLAIKELPAMLVNTSSVSELGAAGSDSLPPMYPANALVSASSDQSWLTIGNISNGVVNFSFSGNTTGAPRTAHITFNSLTVTVTQSASSRTPMMALRDNNGSIRLSVYPSANLSNSFGVFASDPSAAQDASGNTFVTARDTFNSIWANVYSGTNSTWSGWKFGGGIVQGVPSIAVDSTGTGWIASRDTYNSYWLVSYTSSGFGTWMPLLGIFSTDPVTASCADGSIYVIGKDNFNSLWSGRYVPGNGFQGWQFGGGIIKGKPAATCGSDNSLYIVAEDNFNSNWMARVSGNIWTGWFYGGAITGVSPRIASLGNGSEAVVILDPTNVVWRTTFAEGTGNGWQPWTSVGGVLQDAAPAGLSGQLYLAGKAPNGDLWWWQQSGNQWTWIGNNGVAAGLLSATPR